MPAHAEAHDHDPCIQKLTADEVQTLADRLFSRGISTLSTYSHREKADLVAASRTLRALLRQYEHATGRQLQTVLLCGRV
jgi:hypothetical protein